MKLGGQGLGGGKMDCELCIMQVSGYPSVSYSPLVDVHHLKNQKNP